MIDDGKRGPADRSRVNLDQDHEVQYWAEQFGVSRERLIRAVRMAGPIVHDVQRDLMEAE
jgi:Protein of unknown function (DUF3606)